MGSSYFGEATTNMNMMGKERSPSNSGGGSSSSSRKGKKNNNNSSDKPKQPQRGLGVAQLEKIRLHGQMGCTYLPSLQSPPYPPIIPTTSLNLQEDLRVQTAYATAVPSSASSFSYSSSTSSTTYGGFNPNMMMGFSEMERANIRYGDSQPSTAARWNPGNNILESHNFAQPNITRHLLNLQGEDALQKKRKKNRSDSMGSSQNSGSSDSQELDLELRLSI